jgi:hypothetical protein
LRIRRDTESNVKSTTLIPKACSSQCRVRLNEK